MSDINEEKDKYSPQKSVEELFLEFEIRFLRGMPTQKKTEIKDWLREAFGQETFPPLHSSCKHDFSILLLSHPPQHKCVKCGLIVRNLQDAI